MADYVKQYLGFFLCESYLFQKGSQVMSDRTDGGFIIVSPDKVRDTLVLVLAAVSAAGNCLVSGGYRPQF
jgi:hypothetical protein